mmetsp:Transcript_115922/g.249088  ORF Transcript_115922/g.249088 Transcript_115922/m.249088 type:complete len:211 (-) Transcript_115922:504-1136(-)
MSFLVSERRSLSEFLSNLIFLSNSSCDCSMLSILLANFMCKSKVSDFSCPICLLKLINSVLVLVWSLLLFLFNSREFSLSFKVFSLSMAISVVFISCSSMYLIFLLSLDSSRTNLSLFSRMLTLFSSLISLVSLKLLLVRDNLSSWSLNRSVLLPVSSDRMVLILCSMRSNSELNSDLILSEILLNSFLTVVLNSSNSFLCNELFLSLFS